MRERALVLYLVLVCSVGAGLALVAVLLSGATPKADLLLLSAALLLLLADRPLLDLRFGHHKESFTWAEVAVVVTLATLPLSTVTALSALCVLVFHFARPVSAVKALFNAASFVIGIVLAGLVLRLVAGTTGQIGLRDALGLAAAAIVFNIWNGAAVATVIALSEQIRVRDVYCRGLLLRVFVCIVNVLVGIGVLVMVQWSRPSLVVLPPVLLLTYAAYRGYLHATQERDVWQQLESASRELNQLEEHAVAQAAITWVAQMLHADRVEVVIDSAPGAPGGAQQAGAAGAAHLRAQREQHPAERPAVLRDAGARRGQGVRGRAGLAHRPRQPRPAPRHGGARSCGANR